MLYGIEKFLPDFISNIQYSPYSPALKWAFIGIIILVVLHMLRPKPFDKTVPSIMFFMREGGKSRRAAFLQRFINNLLFLLQLLVIFLMGFAMLEPYIIIKKDIVADNTFLVIDTSASMQAGNAFERATAIAKDNLKGKVTLILVSDTPLLVLEKGSQSEALSILNDLKPKPFGSAISDAIRLASDLLGEENGRILIISDFLNNIGPNPLTEKEKAEAKGQIVDFVNVHSAKSNIGIIDLKFDNPKSTFFIRNFNSQENIIDVKINGEVSSLTMAPKSIVKVPVQLNPGLNHFELLVEDDVEYDNKAYASTPADRKIPVLWITNRENMFLESAIRANEKIELSVGEPPIVPEINHDLIILDYMLPDMLLPETIKNVKKAVEKGASLIIIANENIGKIDYKDLLPVVINDLIKKEQYVKPALDNKLTRDIVFGKTLSYYDVSAKDGYLNVGSVDNNITVLGYMQHKKGTVFYYGIDEDENFRLSPSYPIFWNSLISFLTDSKDLEYYNHLTGSIITIPEDDEIRSPDGEKFKDFVMFDSPGIYELGDVNFAVNFFNEPESDIFSTSEKLSKVGKDVKDINRKELPENLVLYSILIILGLLIVELVYIKYRGDV